jgi:hypothetical protein
MIGWAIVLDVWIQAATDTKEAYLYNNINVDVIDILSTHPKLHLIFNLNKEMKRMFWVFFQL